MRVLFAGTPEAALPSPLMGYPGALGIVGSALGDAGINIVAAALTQESGGEFAVLILRVEREVPDELLESIAQSLHAESFQLNLS